MRPIRADHQATSRAVPCVCVRRWRTSNRRKWREPATNETLVSARKRNVPNWSMPQCTPRLMCNVHSVNGVRSLHTVLECRRRDIFGIPADGSGISAQATAASISRTSVTYYLTWFLFIAHADLPTRAHAHSSHTQFRIRWGLPFAFDADKRCQFLCSHSHANWYAICKRIVFFFVFFFFVRFSDYFFSTTFSLSATLLGDSIPTSSAFKHRHSQTRKHIERLSASFVSIRANGAVMCAIGNEANMRPAHTSDNKLHIYDWTSGWSRAHSQRDTVWPFAWLSLNAILCCRARSCVVVSFCFNQLLFVVQKRMAVLGIGHWAIGIDGHWWKWQEWQNER